MELGARTSDAPVSLPLTLVTSVVTVHFQKVEGDFLLLFFVTNLGLFLFFFFALSLTKRKSFSFLPLLLDVRLNSLSLCAG